MTDLRAERIRAVVQLIAAYPELPADGRQFIADCYEVADAIIQHGLDNPPAWEAVKESLTVGWVKSSDRLPTEADAPRGWIHVSNFDFTDKSIMHVSLAHRWSYWHPATGIYQIPEPPR
jgi:uncharacterized protein (DUF2461 family)